MLTVQRGSGATIPSLATTTNYITYGKFESNTLPWATYADAAGSIPIDGTGGSPNITLTRNTTTPLFGLGDGLITKDAANRQGEGVSYDFALDNGALPEILQLEFSYITSANYVSNDVGVYIYDITNSILIYPTIVNLPASTTANKFIATFLANSTSASYRLIFHIATTNASAYTINIDEVYLSLQQDILGSPISGPVAYTPTIVGLGTTTLSYCNYYRRGSKLRVEFKLTTGTVSAVAVSFSLPAGLTAYIPSGITVIGHAFLDRSAVSEIKQVVINITDGSNIANFGRVDYALGTYGPFNSVVGTGFYSTSVIAGFFEVDVAQWSVNINLASDFTEYAFNTSTTNADDTTSFGYGTAGGSFPVALSATRSKRIQFTKPLQATDKWEIEVYDKIVGEWFPISANAYGSLAYIPQGAQSYGIYASPVSGSLTQIDVRFARYANPGSSYAGAGVEWTNYNNGTNSINKWRVRKVSNGNMAEQPPNPTVIPVSSDYTLPDGIGNVVVVATTSSALITITVGSAAANPNREIEVVNSLSSSASYEVKIAGTIHGYTNVYVGLPGQSTRIKSIAGAYTIIGGVKQPVAGEPDIGGGIHLHTAEVVNTNPINTNVTLADISTQVPTGTRLVKGYGLFISVTAGRSIYVYRADQLTVMERALTLAGASTHFRWEAEVDNRKIYWSVTDVDVSALVMIMTEYIL